MGFVRLRRKDLGLVLLLMINMRCLHSFTFINCVDQIYLILVVTNANVYLGIQPSIIKLKSCCVHFLNWNILLYLIIQTNLFPLLSTILNATAAYTHKNTGNSSNQQVENHFIMLSKSQAIPYLVFGILGKFHCGLGLGSCSCGVGNANHTYLLVIHVIDGIVGP